MFQSCDNVQVMMHKINNIKSLFNPLSEHAHVKSCSLLSFKHEVSKCAGSKNKHWCARNLGQFESDM